MQKKFLYPFLTLIIALLLFVVYKYAKMDAVNNIFPKEGLEHKLSDIIRMKVKEIVNNIFPKEGLEHKLSDIIRMKVKEITYGDKTHMVTLEFINLSSVACEFGDSTASIEHMRRVLIILGINFFQGSTGSAYAFMDRKLFKISPKQTIIVKIPLSVYDKKITSAEKRICYTFSYMRIGESASPRYSIYELSSSMSTARL